MSGQNYDSSGSSDLYVIVMFGALFGAFHLLSENFEYIAFVWKYLRLLELGMFYWMPDWVPIYGSLQISETWDWLYSQPYDLIHEDSVAWVDDHFSGWFAWLPGLICIYWGMKFMGKSLDPTSNYNMEQLLVRMQDYFPHVPQFVEEDPIYKDIELNREKKETYRWAMGMKPDDFARLQPPLNLEEAAKENKSLDAAIWDGAEGFDLDLAEKAFVAQLGERFTGIGSLNNHEKRLYEFMVSRMTIDPSIAEEKIVSLSKVILDLKDKDPKISYEKLSETEQMLYKAIQGYVDALVKKQKDKFDAGEFIHYKNVEKMIKNPKFGKPLKNVCCEMAMSMHGFKVTAFMALLDEIRKGGVVPTLEFQWIKKYDRTLSLALSSVGRKVAFVECAGCFGHFIIEQQIGRPLSRPEVHEAVTGLHRALNLSDE